MQLTVYIAIDCLQCNWLFTMQMTVYNAIDCLQSNWLFTMQMTVYNAIDCLQCNWLFTMQLTVYNANDCLQCKWLFRSQLSVYDISAGLQIHHFYLFIENHTYYLTVINFCLCMIYHIVVVIVCPCKKSQVISDKENWCNIMKYL